MGKPRERYKRVNKPLPKDIKHTVIQEVMNGMGDQEIERKYNLSHRLISAWKRSDPVFKADHQFAKTVLETKLTTVLGSLIDNAVSESVRLKAVMYSLERRFPDRWGERKFVHNEDDKAPLDLFLEKDREVFEGSEDDPAED